MMQLLAMVTMLIDHIGLMLGAGHDLWRVLGRVAMPIYSYCIVMGYKHTSSRKKYIIRLGLIAAAAQIPYMIALEQTDINIVGTFILCLLVLWAMDRAKNIFMLTWIPLAGILAVEVLPFEYGSYALLLILCYRYFKSHLLVAAHFVLNIVFLFYHGWLIQCFSIVPTLILVYSPSIYRVLDQFKFNRLIWRVFYPAHLAALTIIYQISKHLIKH
jgi:hypothetical protein